MKRLTIARRAMLRGAGGAALALPALEIMGGAGRGARAAAGQAPKRYLVTYFGTPIAAAYRANTPGQYSDNGGRYDYVTPAKTGRMDALPPTIGLKPIYDLGVQADMGIVSGLKIPVSGKRGVAPQGPAGMDLGFHGKSQWQQLCGTATLSDGEFAPPVAASSDQLILDAISDPSLRFPKGLQLTVTPPGAWGYSASDIYFQISTARPSGSSRDKYGRPIARGLPPYVQPTETFKALFGTGIAGTGSSSGDAAKALARRKGIVNAVKDRAAALRLRLGQADKLRLDRHLELVNALEKRLDVIDPRVGSTCQSPDSGKFAQDPTLNKERYQLDKDGGEIWDPDGGWSDETTRAGLERELIYHAFQCDMTRSVSWLFDGGQSTLNLYRAIGVKNIMHNVTHTFVDPYQTKTMAQAIAWYLTPVAQLVKDLSTSTDIDGSRMIDNTVIVSLFEGGHGVSSDEAEVTNPAYPNTEGYRAGERWAHSVENMVAVVAGGKTFGLQPGQHIACGNNKHPAEAIYTMLKAMGLGEPFGEISTEIPEMRRAPA